MGLHARPGELVHRASRRLRVDIGHDDSLSLGSQLARNGRADARGPCGDDRNPVYSLLRLHVRRTFLSFAENFAPHGLGI